MSPDERGFLIEARAQLAPADQAAWDAQRRLMKSAGAQFDGKDTWVLRLGSLAEDQAALYALGCLARAEEEHGTHVTLTIVRPPAQWAGPVLTVDRQPS